MKMTLKWVLKDEKEVDICILHRGALWVEGAQHVLETFAMLRWFWQMKTPVILLDMCGWYLWHTFRLDLTIIKILMWVRIMAVDAIQQEKCAEWGTMEWGGGEDDGVLHSSALKVVRGKDVSTGIWERIARNQVWDLWGSRILELKEERA